MLHGEVAQKVIGEMVGVSIGVGGTHGADDLLRGGGVTVLLGDVVSQLGLREPQLGTQRTCEGEGSFYAVALSTIV